MASLEPTVDLAVVGAGLAGLVAGTRAAELGLSVLVFERGPNDRYPCNTRYSGGICHVARHDVGDAPSTLAEAIRNATGGFAQPDLVELVATSAAAARDWLADHGASFERLSEDQAYANVLAPLGLRTTWIAWEGKGPDRLLRALAGRLEAAGGRLRLGCEVYDLIRTSGTVHGVVVRGSDGDERLLARAVLLADGGFSANQELLQEITPDPAKLFLRGAASAIGSGMRMARAAGAATVSLGTFYGHLLSRNAFHDDRLWPYPLIDTVAVGGILVDAGGRRPLDESRGGVFLANGIARSSDPLGFTAICDRRCWEGPAATGLLPPNPNLERSGGTLFEADDLVELARLASIDPIALKDAAVAVADGTAGPPLATPPFRAVPVCAGITYTTGGVLIDRHGRALDGDSRPVPGLYAAGATTGGLEGGPGAGYTGGLMKAVITALVAAEHLAGVPAISEKEDI